MYVTPGLGLGGAESALASLLQGTRSAPVEPLVVDLLGDDGGVNAARLRESGVRVVHLGASRSGWDLPVALMRLAWQIRRFRPHTVQGWMYYGDVAATLSLLASGRRRETRLCWGVRCSQMDLSAYGPRLRSSVWMARRLSGIPDVVIANSDAGRTAHLRLGYRARRFEVVPNGIAMERFPARSARGSATRAALGLDGARPVVVSVARVDPMKDHETFLAVADRLPGAQFLAVGAGTAALPGRANVLGLGERTDVSALLGAADVFLSTSAFGEGFPNALAEAMASGLPPVATAVGDAAAIVGDTGHVCRARDAQGLAEAVASLLGESPGARRDRGDRARERIARTYSVARMVDAFDAIHRDGHLPSVPDSTAPTVAASPSRRALG